MFRSYEAGERPHSMTSSARSNTVCGIVSRDSSFSVAPAEAGAQGRKRRAWPPLGARFRGHDDNCVRIPCVRIGPRTEAALAPRHSMTSSARSSTVCGIVSPSAFAVSRLMTSSKRVDWMTGESAGAAPCRMRPA